MQLSERPVRSPAKLVTPAPKKIDEPRVELSKPALSLPPVPEFLKAESSERSKKIDKTQLTQKVALKTEVVSTPAVPAKVNVEMEVEKEFDDFVEPLLFEPAHSSDNSPGQPVPVLLEEEKAPSRFYEAATEWASEFVGRSTEFAQTLKPYSLPLALAVICFGSGGYLLRSAKQIREGAWLLPIQNPVHIASDIAPVNDPASQVVAAQATAAQTPSQTPTQVQSQTQVQPQVQPKLQNDPVRVIASTTRVQRAQPARTPEEKVEVLTNNAVLRAGPGLHYNKVGTARAELQLLVKGTFDNWIEVRTESGNKTAWIRSDLVKPIKQVAQQEAQP
jgi:hypothetical protein